MARQHELTVQLGAELNANYKKAFADAQNATGKLESAIRKVQNTQNNIATYQKQQQAMEQTKQKLELLRQQYEKTENDMKDAGTASGAYASQLAKLQGKINSTEQSLLNQEQKLNKTRDALQHAGVDTENLAGETNRLENEMEDLKQQEEQAAQQSAVLEAKMQQQEAAMEQANQATEELSESSSGLSNIIQGAIVGASAVAASAFLNLAHRGVRALGQELKETVTISMDFEQQMSTVQSILLADADTMQMLSDKAREMGATTAFTAEEAGQAMEYMAMAGWNAQEIMDGLSAVMDAAAASGEELGTTSDIVTDALTAFNLKASDTQHFVDVLATTATKSNTTITGMGETFKEAATLAGAMNYKIEDMSVAIGLMANSGIKGSRAGTALKNIIANMVSPTDAQAQAMKTLKLSMDDGAGGALEFSEVITQLRDAFSGLDETQKAEYASTLAGKHGMAGLLAIVNATDEDIQDLQISIENCDGAAKEMANTRLDNLAGDVTLLSSAWSGLQETLGSRVSPALRTVVQDATDVATKLNEVASGGESLEDAYDRLTSGIDNNQKILALVDDYRALKDTIDHGALSTDALKDAQEQLKTIKEQIIALSPEYVGAMEDEEAAMDAAADAAKGLSEHYGLQLEGEIATGAEEYAKALKTEAEYAEKAATANATLNKARENHVYTEDQTENLNKALDILIEYKNVLDSIDQSTPEGMTEYSDTMAEAARYAAEIIGQFSGGVEFTGIDNAIERVQEFMNTDFDAGQLESGLNRVYKQYDKFSEKAGEAKQVQEGFIEVLASAVSDGYYTEAELLELLTEKFGGTEEGAAMAQDAINRMHDVMDGKAAEEEADAMDDASEAVEGLGDAAEDTTDQLTPMSAAMSVFASKVKDGSLSLAEAQDMVLEYGQNCGDAAGAMSSFQDALGEMDMAEYAADQVDGLTKALDDMIAAYEAAYDSARSNVGLFQNMTPDEDDIQSVYNMMSAMDSELMYMQSYMDNLATVQSWGLAESLVQSLADGSTDSAAYLQAIVNEGQGCVDDLNEKWTETEQMKDTFGDTLAQMDEDYQDAMDAVMEKTDEVVSDLNQSEEAAAAGMATMQAYAAKLNSQGQVAVATAQSIAAQVSAALNNVGSISVSGGGSGGGGATARVARYASGTESAQQGWAWVGEEGPELMYMHGGERVLNAEKSAAVMDGAGGGFAPVFHIVVNGNADAETRAALTGDLTKAMDKWWKEKTINERRSRWN